PLLTLQDHDLALDRLMHRRETLAERAVVADAEAKAQVLVGEVEQLRASRDEIVQEERQLDDEAQALGAQATAAEKRLYSGEISSPRELQALQADIDQLKRHQRAVEDRQLAAMERREPLDGRVAELERELDGVNDVLSQARSALEGAEATIDAEAATERKARDEIAGGIEPRLVEEYEQRRAKANGVGVARLIGSTCQGCHLSIPATEVDRI